jgi:hypothetical protein
MLQDKKTNTLLLLLIICTCLFVHTGCVNTKKTSAVWVYKGQTYYQRAADPLGSGTDKLVKKQLVKGVRAKVTTEATKEHISVTFFNKMSDKEKVVYSRDLLANEVAPPRLNFFPFDSVTDATHVGFFQSGAFKYLEIKPVYQALSIPFKLRPKLNDTIKSVASASFNVGITAGLKFTHNVYKKVYFEDKGKQTFLNNYTKKLSFSPGWFLGPTVIDLKAANTNNIIKKDRSVAGLTTGAFIVVGYNEFNLGLAAGWDLGLNEAGKSWIYHKKPWVGFVLAIDLIK